MNLRKVYDIRMPESISNFEFKDKGRSSIAPGGVTFIATFLKSVAHAMKMWLLLKTCYKRGMILLEEKEKEGMWESLL